jgi:ferritin-like metal-binding protein YciE
MNNKVQNTHESSLLHFFILELQEIYEAEKFLCKSLAQLQNETSTDEVRLLLIEHRTETEIHVKRLEEIFSIIDVKASLEKPLAIESIFQEVGMILRETEPGSSTRDAALIIIVQKIEHYEIATYGGLVQLATTLGFEEITELLDKTLQEEKDTDILLSDLAEKRVNWLAETEDRP